LISNAAARPTFGALVIAKYKSEAENTHRFRNTICVSNEYYSGLTLFLLLRTKNDNIVVIVFAVMFVWLVVLVTFG